MNKSSPNLTVVPWYNSAEWRSVYELLYDKESNDENKRRALSVMHIWRNRVNLLCSGVEGTTIILEALFLNNVDDRTLQTVYSSAIMRFINVCINVKDRKCTIHELGRKYDIPTWIIKIRHEFAHDQKLPPLFVCKKALYFALDWLKENYWKYEYDNIQDYISTREFTIGDQVSKILLQLFCDITLASIRNDTNKLAEIPNELLEVIRYRIGTELERGWKQKTILDIQEELINRLDNFIILYNEDGIINLLYNYLMESCKLCSDFTEILDKWQIIMCKLIKSKMFIPLLNKLHKETCNRFNTRSTRLLSALWIRELSSMINTNDGDCNLTQDVLIELKTFLDRILSQPTIYGRQYLPQLLKAARIPTESADKIWVIYEIYTNGMDDDNEDDFDSSASKQQENQNCLTAASCTAWTLVTDNRFDSVPLGVLPNERYNCNPLLDEYLSPSITK